MNRKQCVVINEQIESVSSVAFTCRIVYLLTQYDNTYRTSLFDEILPVVQRPFIESLLAVNIFPVAETPSVASLTLLESLLLAKKSLSRREPPCCLILCCYRAQPRYGKYGTLTHPAPRHALARQGATKRVAPNQGNPKPWRTAGYYRPTKKKAMQGPTPLQLTPGTPR